MKTLKTLLKDSLERLHIECKINRFIQPQSIQQKLVTTGTPVIFDIGAHHGQTYLDYRARFPNAIIHLIEPFAESVDILKAAAGADPYCTVHQIALADTCEQKTLYVNEASATNSLNALSSGAAERWAVNNLKQKTSLSVDVKTLDSLTTELGVSTVEIVKMDVQGAEMAVLSGAAQLLARQAIGLLQFEFISADTYENQRPMHEYLQLMDHYQYTLIDFYQPLRRDGRLMQCDLLFANQAYATIAV